MDKTAIRNFAIEARKILMKSAITEAGFYGITKDGCKDPVQKGNDFEVYETVAGTENRIFGDDIKRRANLVQAIKTLGFEQVIEETAYTWFNRIIAIRFMEVNNYLPTRVRVLSSETGSGTPDIITQADTVELNLTSDELEKIQTAKRENRYDDAFRMLFIKQCNELNAILPGLFEKTDDYMELLLKITYTGDGVIRMLVDSIPEDNFNVETEGQVEIIGWMYQYYNTELKDDTFAKLKKNVKITKERIPAATQLFTPDWIVRYMVENSLGRVWIEHLRAVNPSVDEKAKAEEFGWKYYLPEAEQEDDVQAQLVEIRKTYKDLTPQDITCIDPCMGSGHILVYMFDVLMDIYRSEGFSEREAVFDILEKNIRGLDIDRRAYQLSYFALMMKARGYNKIFFRGHEDIDGNRVQASPKVFAIEESNSIDRSVLQYYGAGMDELQKNNAINQMNGLLDAFIDAKEYGSVLNVDVCDWNLLRRYVNSELSYGQMTFGSMNAETSRKLALKLVDLGEILAHRYDAVVTNPPYMSSAGMGNKLNNFVKNNYQDSKNDMFAVFIERCFQMCKNNGFQSMITQHVWMFLASFQELRKKVIKKDIVNMLHLGARAFDEISGEIVQTTSFILRISHIKNYEGTYCRLIKPTSENAKAELYLSGESRYITRQEYFSKIEGSPLAYWVSKQIFGMMDGDKLDKYFTSGGRFKTCNDELYLRFWWEPVTPDTNWHKYCKGGDGRKYVGNEIRVLRWTEESQSYYKKNGGVGNKDYWNSDGITWATITTSKPSFRKKTSEFFWSSSAPTIFSVSDVSIETVLAYLNSKPSEYLLGIFNPTASLTVADVLKLPYNLEWETSRVKELLQMNDNYCRCDWDSFETSCGFMVHPLIRGVDTISEAYTQWQTECEQRFIAQKQNEEEINQFFIDAYNLQDELEAFVDERDITVRKANLEREVRSLISYAVGCMFGRYSLDRSGLIYAGDDWDSSNYSTFIPDVDAIIPISDEGYFEDDIVGRFEEFIEKAYGQSTKEENMNFIAKVLGGRGTAKEIIRDYFLNDFYSDHVKIYQKKPIYWMFDSGKQNGFKCLIYIHRYTADSVGLIRSEYLTKSQAMIENALKNAEYAINTSSSAVDRAQATKKRDKYLKQLAEIRAYYPALSHIALQRIELDLDDGVKANYAKFQGIEVSVEGEKKQKVDLLAKI